MHQSRYLLMIVLLVLPLAACGEVAGGLGQQPDAAATATPAPTATATASPAATMTVAPLPAKQTPALDKTVCPVTLPPDPPFAPPSQRPASTNLIPPLSYPDEAFWYGNEGLWTSLHNEGSYDARDFWKMFWWSDGYNWTKEPMPDLKVTAARIDADAPAIAASPATNGYHEDLGSFMLVGLDIPTSGCWEITGQYNEHSVSVVAWIATATVR